MVVGQGNGRSPSPARTRTTLYAASMAASDALEALHGAAAHGDARLLWLASGLLYYTFTAASMLCGARAINAPSRPPSVALAAQMRW